MKTYWLSEGEPELRGMLEASFVGSCGGEKTQTKQQKTPHQNKTQQSGIFCSMGETLSGNGHVALQDFFLHLLRTLC